MTLAVRNWQKFQHYKGRTPPWIKLYTELLDDERFLALPDAAKGQLCALFLLAAKRGNALPDKPNILRVLIGCTGKLHLSELIDGGWLTTSGDASKDASKSDSNGASELGSGGASPSRASPRSREEELETELELERTSSSARAGFLAAMPEGRRTGWEHTLRGWEQGMGAPGGKAFTPSQIDAGLAEYLATENAPTFSARHVVRYVESAARAPMAGRAPRRGDSFLDLIEREAS